MIVWQRSTDGVILTYSLMFGVRKPEGGNAVLGVRGEREVCAQTEDVPLHRAALQALTDTAATTLGDKAPEFVFTGPKGTAVPGVVITEVDDQIVG